jgi:signal transduction histidine kinase
MRFGDDRFDYFAKLTLLFLVYFATARIGLSLGAVNDFATLVWPPTGIALASMLLLGYRYWPGIALGAFLINFLTGASPPVALAIAAGNTFEALIGAYLLTRFTKIHISLERVRDVMGLIFFGAVASTLVSATIGSLSLFAGGIISASALNETWFSWWVGNALGNLIVAPLILVLSARFQSPLVPQRLIKAAAPVMLLVTASFFVFYGLPRFGVEPFRFYYIVFPMLVWIALKFGQRGGVVATFVVSIIAIWSTIATHDTSSDITLGQSLLLLQSFIGITAATFMTMAAVVTESEQTHKQEQKLLQRTEFLTKQRARLEAINRAKDEFISIASHQLRTPATGVKQYLGMLLDSYAGKLNKRQRTFVETAYVSNERQIKIINDLLYVARLDAGKLRLEKDTHNLTKLISDIVKQQSKELEKRNQRLVYAPGKKKVNALVDREKLRMVLENIIDNASKYSHENGKVKVSLNQADGHVHMQISDSGIGIDKKDHKKLFQKFSRIENANSSFINGSGLGLYWAKKVVDLHGGTISLASELDKGSTFTVSLPLQTKNTPIKQ